MMDNCLASNSETGGVGCDNMTMTIVGFLRGRTKDEWYEEIAKRVANGDGPCAPPEYGMMDHPSFGFNCPSPSKNSETDHEPTLFSRIPWSRSPPQLRGKR